MMSVRDKKVLTIVVAEQQTVETVETEEVEKVPGEGRDPAHVHVGSFYSALKHRLETQRQWERKLDCEEFRRMTRG